MFPFFYLSHLTLLFIFATFITSSPYTFLPPFFKTRFLCFSFPSIFTFHFSLFSSLFPSTSFPPLTYFFLNNSHSYFSFPSSHYTSTCFFLLSPSFHFLLLSKFTLFPSVSKFPPSTSIHSSNSMSLSLSIYILIDLAYFCYG